MPLWTQPGALQVQRVLPERGQCPRDCGPAREDAQLWQSLLEECMYMEPLSVSIPSIILSPLQFPCGHRCMSICHSGKCPNPELCRKKVRIFCVCKRIKLEISCDKHRAGQTTLDCDAQCSMERSKAEAIEQQQLAEKKRQEEERNRIELEKFEKKFGKRKHKERKTVDVKETKREINWQRMGIYAVSLLAVLGALAVAYYGDN